MQRREFITLLGVAAAAWPLTAGAQQGVKVPRIGFLYPGPRQAVAARLEALLSGLRTAGYSAPAQVEIVVRIAEDDPGRVGPLMEEIIRQNVDVIFANGPAVVQAARSATQLIPIIALDLETDPVASGLAASIAHPGGNITGLFFDFPNFTAKWLIAGARYARRRVRKPGQLQLRERNLFSRRRCSLPLLHDHDIQLMISTPYNAASTINASYCRSSCSIGTDNPAQA